MRRSRWYAGLLVNGRCLSACDGETRRSAQPKLHASRTPSATPALARALGRRGFRRRGYWRVDRPQPARPSVPRRVGAAQRPLLDRKRPLDERDRFLSCGKVGRGPRVSSQGLGVRPRDPRLLSLAARLDFEVGSPDAGSKHVALLLEAMRQAPPGATWEFSTPLLLPVLGLLGDVR